MTISDITLSDAYQQWDNHTIFLDDMFLDSCLSVCQLLGPDGLLKVSRILSHMTTFLSQIRIIKFIEDL